MTEFGGWPYFAIGSAVYWAGSAFLLWELTQSGTAALDQYVYFGVVAILLYGLLTAIWRPWTRDKKPATRPGTKVTK